MKKLIGILLATLAIFSMTFVSCNSETESSSEPAFDVYFSNSTGDTDYSEEPLVLTEIDGVYKAPTIYLKTRSNENVDKYYVFYYEVEMGDDLYECDEEQIEDRYSSTDGRKCRKQYKFNDFVTGVKSKAGLYTVTIFIGKEGDDSFKKTIDILIKIGEGTSAVPPTITTNIAASNNAIVDDGTKLTVVATGDAPLTYQWYKDGSIISGETGSSYTVDGDGTYYVKVTNNAGSVTSYNVIVSSTDVVLPVITAQPTDMVIADLNSNTNVLSAKATAKDNAKIVAVWYCDGATAGAQSVGTGTLSTTHKPTEFGDYVCKFYTVVDDVKSPEVVTDYVTVEEKAIAVSITGISEEGYVGTPINVEVYTEVPCIYTYTWTMHGNDSGKTVTIDGETTNTYTLTAEAWEEYLADDESVNVAVTVVAESKATGSKVTQESSYCTFIVSEVDVPKFSTQPSGTQTVYCNEKVTLSANATVSDGGTITYQWYKNGNIISGATNASYEVSFDCDDDDGKTNKYYVRATNTLDGKSAYSTSTPAYITVNHVSPENGAGNGGFDFN